MDIYVCLQLVIYDQGVNYQEQQLDFSVLFVNNNLVVLEIGFSMGKSLIEMALNAPEKNFLGIEVHG